ncbi:MAG: alpha/beta hydrolase [Microthrixaceae bacterium]|nr:alpha/beta hydrolase [Microthrixaceae bacterium]
MASPLAAWKSRPRFERQSAWALLAAINGRRPARYSRYFQVPSFFMSWGATEAAVPWAALNAVRTVGAIRRGEHRSASGKAAVAAQLAAIGAAASFVVEGRRTDEQFNAALAPWLDDQTIRDRPSSVRAGAVVPLFYGGRNRRSRSRGIPFSPESRGLRLDVYEPLTSARPDERRPAIVQIHGGAWAVGDKREQGIPLLNHLAANGWVGFNVNYRLSPRVRAPEHLIDCKRAIAWIRDHADDYGIDPDFICVTGGSAGGHLSALCALTANDAEFQPGFEDADTSVQAAVPFYGAYDMADTSLMVKGYRETFLEPVVFGSRFSDDPTPFEKYSPIRRVRPDAPPMMIIHGTRDALIPIEAARPFAQRLGEVSESAVVWVELDGAQHAFDIFPSARTVRTIEYVERFLDGCHRGVIK